MIYTEKLRKLMEKFDLVKTTITRKDLIKGHEYNFKVKDQSYGEYKWCEFIGIDKFDMFAFKYKNDIIHFSPETEYDYFFDMTIFKHIIKDVRPNIDYYGKIIEE